MTITLLLALIGLGLIFLEFFMPGAILAILGSCLLIASLVLLVLDRGVAWGTLYFLILGLLVFLTCRLAMWRLRRSAHKGDFYLDQDQEGYAATSFNRDLVGKAGVVSTELKPAGHVVVEGKQYQALSETGFAVKGESVQIVGGKGSHLIVRKT